jgi:hypothetical protein
MAMPRQIKQRDVVDFEGRMEKDDDAQKPMTALAPSVIGGVMDTPKTGRLLDLMQVEKPPWGGTSSSASWKIKASQPGRQTSSRSTDTVRAGSTISSLPRQR